MSEPAAMQGYDEDGMAVAVGGGTAMSAPAAMQAGRLATTRAGRRRGVPLSGWAGCGEPERGARRCE